MKMPKIKPPKYKIGRNILNEYELRNLMLNVCKGFFNEGIVVKDEKGYSATILKDGSLSNNLYGLNINSNFTLDMLQHRRIKEQSSK